MIVTGLELSEWKRPCVVGSVDTVKKFFLLEIR